MDTKLIAVAIVLILLGLGAWFGAPFIDSHLDRRWSKHAAKRRGLALITRYKGWTWDGFIARVEKRKTPGGWTHND